MRWQGRRDRRLLRTNSPGDLIWPGPRRESSQAAHRRQWPNVCLDSCSDRAHQFGNDPTMDVITALTLRTGVTRRVGMPARFEPGERLAAAANVADGASGISHHEMEVLYRTRHH